MATNRFTGASSSDWFDPSNWSLGVVPAPGDAVDLFGVVAADASAADVAGLAIDMSGSFTTVGNVGSGLYLATFDLTADQLGAPSSPVAIDVTADSGADSNAGISFNTFYGSIDVHPGQHLTVGTRDGTIDGDVTIETGARFGVVGYTNNLVFTIPAPPLTVNGAVSIEGGTFDVNSADFTGSGSVTITDGGTFRIAANAFGPATQTIGVAFGAGGGTLDATALQAGYGGTITGFGPGDTISAYGKLNAGDALVTTYADGTLTITDPANLLQQSFVFAGDYNPSDFQVFQTGQFTDQITYGPTDTWTGANGGNWFDPANWSTGAIPTAATDARIYGGSGPAATGAPLLAGTLDLSGSFDLRAATIGAPGAPVAIIATDNSGVESRPQITFGTLDGSILVTTGQSLTAIAGPSGLTIDGNVTVNNYATLDVFANAGPVAIGGTIAVGGVLLLDAASISGAGTIALDGIGVVGLSGLRAGAADLPVDFRTGGALDVTAGPGGYAGLISGFDSSRDEILAPYDGSPSGAPDASFTNGTLTIVGLTTDQTFIFAGDRTLADFNFVVDNNVIEIFDQPCFAAGTRIRTDTGLCPVEQLTVGDLLILADGNTAPIHWLGHRRQTDGHVIRIRAGALGRALPTRDLVLSDDHALLLDGVLIQAGLLTNGHTILAEHRESVTFWHVELDRHAILFAEGAASESYLDTGNRGRFANCPLSYDPILATSQDLCAEMVFQGDRLRAILNRLPAAALAC